MSQEEGSNETVELVGLPIAEAVEAVLTRDDSRDPETVRATLESVTVDGVVSRAALREALAEAAKVVSTPETRVELAAIELSEGRGTAEAEGVIDVDTVRARLDEFEARLEAVEEEVESLGPRLRDLVDRRGDPGGAYEVAAGIRELGAEATELQGTADELQQDVESFGRWLTTPETRIEELESEVAAVEESLADLAGAVDALAAAIDEEVTGTAAPSDPGVTWADATLRTRVVALLVADLRAERADLQAWPTAGGGDVVGADRLEELADRLDRLEERRGTLAERLDALADSAWTDRFGEHVEEFETVLEGFEPPVPWGEVDAALERHRVDLEG